MLQPSRGVLNFPNGHSRVKHSTVEFQKSLTYPPPSTNIDSETRNLLKTLFKNTRRLFKVSNTPSLALAHLYPIPKHSFLRKKLSAPILRP